MSESEMESETEDVSAAMGEIVKTSEEKQIATGPVLVPGRPDKEGDQISAENIEEVAYDYMENYQKIDEDHDRRARSEHSIVESYIAPAEFVLGETRIAKGTWVVSARLGEEAWSKVKSGEYNGFSIDGRGRRNE